MTTHTPAPAQQARLTDDEIRSIWVEHGLDDEAVEYFARAIESALLSKLRAPVADERAAFEAWAKKKKMPLARIGEQYDDFWVDHAWNGWQARAALASAPVAGQAQRRGKFLPEHVTQQMIWNVQAVIEGECGGLALDERQARNVMSFLMNEHGPDAAPQASEAVRFLENEAAKLDAQRRPSGAVVRDIAKRLSAALSAQPGAQKNGGSDGN